MLTYIKKNLIIAALEDSLLTGKKAAGISTLAEMDMLLAALRSRLNANPDAVTDKSIWQMYARLNALKFPSVSNIWWAFNDLSMFDSVDTDTIGWSNVTGKPATFPPKAHSHDYASITEKPATFPPDVHAHDYASITNKPATFPPDVHAHDYASITEKPATFPPDVHAHDYASITNKPATFPPDVHAHDLLQIGGLLLRYNSAEGYLEQSANAGATWTPLVSESAPPSATAYALAWTDGSAIFSRQVPGAWLNGNVQIWMRVYLPSSVFFWCGDVTMTYNSGGIYLTSYNRNGDGTDYPDDRTTITEGWHDVALQWTQAANTCILYIDGIGGTQISAYKRTLDAATNYDVRFQATGLKVASLVMSDQLTWNATTAAKDTIGTPLFSLPLSEGSGATATDSTGTAWTIPAGVVWEAL